MGTDNIADYVNIGFGCYLIRCRISVAQLAQFSYNNRGTRKSSFKVGSFSCYKQIRISDFLWNVLFKCWLNVKLF